MGVRALFLKMRQSLLYKRIGQVINWVHFNVRVSFDKKSISYNIEDRIRIIIVR